MKQFLDDHEPLPEQRCTLCGSRSRLIASHLKVCGRCIRQRWDEAKPLIEIAHANVRHEFGMAAYAPQTAGGVRCPLCAHHCVLGESEVGYCGLRMAHDSRLVHL